MTAIAVILCACKKQHSLEDPEAAGKLCGATTKQEGAKYPTCHRPSGWGTNHASVGRCKLHGGATPIESGRYSKVTNVRLKDLIEHHQQDVDPLNIMPEIAAGRALFVDFINRHGEFTEALLAWHESFEAQRVPLPEDKVMAFEGVIREWEIALRESVEPTERQLSELAAANAFMNILRGKGVAGLKPMKPRTVLDISDAYRILSEITKMVERVEKIRAENAISRADMNRVMDHMGRAVMKHVPDLEALKKIRDEWLSISLSRTA